MYWVFRTHAYYWRNQPVQVKLTEISKRIEETLQQSGPFRSALQMEPYGVNLALSFMANTEYPHYDNYMEGTGYTLYSERLVQLLNSYGVKAEVFPVQMVDQDGRELPGFRYQIFHLLEGVQPAMDELKSQWTDDRRIGIPRLVLDLQAFEHRPIFYLNHLYLPLMRDDVKQAIQREKMTGFDFLKPEHYHSGHYGIVLEWDE